MQFTDAARLQGMEVRGRDDEKIGQVDELWVDEATGRPEWIAVKTGRLGGKVSLVPLASAEARGDALVVPYDKDFIKDAPYRGAEGGLSTAEEAQLFDYYGIPYSGQTVTATGSGRGQPSSSDDAMTRSEERLQVGKERVEAGRVRLRKYVVAEQVQQTVPVTRETVRVEREPITDQNIDQALSGPEITESEHEVILHEEHPVVAKETVPVERVRLTKDAVTDEEQISEEVRKEQIDVTDPADRSGSGRRHG